MNNYPWQRICNHTLGHLNDCDLVTVTSSTISSYRSNLMGALEEAVLIPVANSVWVISSERQIESVAKYFRESERVKTKFPGGIWTVRNESEGKVKF